MSARKQTPYPIVEAGWQSTKLRLFVLPVIVGGLAGLYYTPWLLTSLPDADGNLEPLVARISLAALVGGVSLLCTVGLWCYQSIYVVRLMRDGDTVVFHTQGLVLPRVHQLPLTAFRSSQEYGGRLNIPGQVSVNAPFQTITVDGWLLPLLVDEQSRHLDRRALADLVRDGERIRRREAKSTANSNGRP